MKPIRNVIGYMNKRVLLLSLAAGSLACQLAVAQTTAPEQALRELNIMRNIFNTALQDRDRRQAMAPPEVLYLNGQGMVFTFNLPGGNFWVNGLQIPSFPGVGAMQFNGFDGNDLNIDFNFDPGAAGNDGNDSGAAVQQQLQSLNDQMRVKQNEMRDLQRDMRDKQRQLPNNSTKGLQLSLETEMNQLGDAMKALGQEIQEISGTINKVQQDYQNERKAAIAKIHAQQSDLIFETLCNYGNTLRSLNKGEHVNVVLKNYADTKTFVYVVAQDQLDSCSSGAALKQAAQGYEM